MKRTVDTWRSIFYWYVIGLLANIVTEASKSSLNGKHMVVSAIPTLVTRFTRNETGYIMKVSGPMSLMLEGFAQLNNLTYSILQVKDTTYEPSRGMPGLMSYVAEGKCDALIAFVMTGPRLQIVDVSHPYLYMPVSLLIPMPSSTVSISAVLESFQIWVWVALIITISSTITFFYLINRFLVCKAKFFSDSTSTDKCRPMRDAAMYVVGLMLHQARYCSSKQLVFRIVAGVICFASLVILSLYHATMISYITSYHPKQLISSAEELVRRPDVNLVVDEGLNIQIVLQSATTGLLKDLGDKLRNYSNSGCIGSNCTKMVKSGSHVYSTTIDPYFYNAMRNDYLATQKCNLEILKKSYMELQLVWGLPKKSPYYDDFNRGTMIMREGGLIVYWMKMFRPNADLCLQQAKDLSSFSPHHSFAPLTLENLNGAFVILAFGFLLAFLVFIVENIVFRCCCKSNKKSS